MSGYSRVTVIGNLTQDPPQKYTNSGKMYTKFNVAVNTGGVSQDNPPPTVFIEVEIWGKQAEFVVEHFWKGKLILVDGRLAQENWEDKNSGRKMSKLKIVADRISFVPREAEKKGSDASRETERRGVEGDYKSSQSAASRPPQHAQERKQASYEEEDDE